MFVWHNAAAAIVVTSDIPERIVVSEDVYQGTTSELAEKLVG
jgi:hypothetical protein